MKVSINESIINKNVNEVNQSKGFVLADLTPEELANRISHGFAFSYQFEKAYRKADNFICSDIIAADFDYGMTLDEALNNEFFINNACILYTTASHTSEKHKFRIIFELPRTITDKTEIRAAQQGLTRKFPADPSAVDAARQFYGSKGCMTHFFCKVLSVEALQDLINLGREPLNQSDRDGKNQRVAGTRAVLGIDDGMMVKTSRGEMARLSDLTVPTPVYCPYHTDSKPSAFTTKSKNGVMGIHCSSCQQTFWEKSRQPTPHDFYEFDQLARQEYNLGIGGTYVDHHGLEFDEPNLNIVFSHQYINVETIGIMPGITLIKSPKGSGKTKYLEQVVAKCKKQKLRVLLVGHRRSLLQALSNSLGLTCYLDTRMPNQSGVYDIDKYYAISIDSLSIHLAPNRHQFDVVLIDESEQVFSHLIADTLDHERRRKSFLVFQHYINVAKTVIALDADLNTVSLHAIQRFGNKNPLIDRRYVLNEYKPLSSQLEVYASENHLLADMLTNLKNGQRLFIACNSKKRVEELVEAIKEDLGSDFPLLSITSANSNDAAVIGFIKNIKDDILNYKALLVSPAMGTGIDITFPEDDSLVDGVYGFFYSKVNTHYEIDQQISRVRHPKYVKIWISQEVYNFEYEVDPIRQELAESGVVPETLKGYEPYSGMPEYDLAEPFLNLYATILSAQRASKNSLKKNFIDLRKHNGWKIVDIVKDDHMASIGSDMSKIGKAAALDQFTNNILSAPVISWEQANALSSKRKRTKLSSEEDSSLERYWIEKFYVETVTRDLLRKDKRSRYRNQIQNLEGVLAGNLHVQKNSDKIKQLLIQIFEVSGLLNSLGKPDVEKLVTLESLGEFAKFCSGNKVRIERLLDIEVRKDIKQKPTAQLNTILSRCGLRVVKSNEYSKGDKKIYEYQIDHRSYDEVMVLIDRRANSKHESED